MTQHIQIRGARQNNLKNIDLRLPRKNLIVITGVSGSGKSSLITETLVAFSQRRFLESLSLQNKSVLNQFPRPLVDRIEGLPPVIDVSPPKRSPHARSTLATITEIHDFLKLLFSRLGKAHCPNCNQVLDSMSKTQIIDDVLAGAEKQKIMILSPIDFDSVDDAKKKWEQIQQQSFVRARYNGEILETGSEIDFKKNPPQKIEAVVDRLVLKDGIESRLSESIDSALQAANGKCIVLRSIEKDWEEQHYQTQNVCTDCQIPFPEIEPQLFSFWSPKGCCLACGGIGSIEDPENSGSEKNRIPCRECEGTRFQKFARNVFLAGTSITDFLRMNVLGAANQTENWIREFTQGKTNNDSETIAKRLLPEILSRLKFLCDVGLSYLNLNRAANTLSAGELQRARLAAGLGSGLSGICFILDEPSTGLHDSDSLRLLEVLKNLRDRGNTVIAVEHHPEIIRSSDFIVEIGPSAGKQGGKIVASGNLDDFKNSKESKTVRVLDQNETLEEGLNGKRTEGDEYHGNLLLTGAKQHNLKNVSLSIPLKKLVAVTGISGSGKSSLILKTLAPALRAKLNRKIIPVGTQCDSLEGFELLQALKVIDQSPIGKNGRSNPATFTGIWTEIRKLFSKTRLARVRGYSPNRFSFNSKDGRCESCLGTGEQKSETSFFEETALICEVCQGRRFNAQTLAVRYRDLSLAEILELSIDEALEFFESLITIASKLKTMQKLGLGYLKLGQPASTLSSGEAQRLKLSSELYSSLSNTMYLLDEPSRGLHESEIPLLISLLKEFVENGNSVVIVEHNLQMIRSADWIIDVGPQAGDDGGEIISTGTVNHVAEKGKGPTSTALKGRALKGT